MDARVGDHVLIEGTHVGDVPRRGEIVEVIPGKSGEHYRVRWERDEHETIFVPGPGCRIEPMTESQR